MMAADRNAWLAATSKRHGREHPHEEGTTLPTSLMTGRLGRQK